VIRRGINWLGQTRNLRHIHATLVLLWAASIVPTLLWWRESVLWVALMSVWANLAAHFSAWQAARAEQSSERGTDRGL
jgi:hypothetical protein